MHVVYNMHSVFINYLSTRGSRQDGPTLGRLVIIIFSIIQFSLHVDQRHSFTSACLGLASDRLLPEYTTALHEQSILLCCPSGHDFSASMHY